MTAPFFSIASRMLRGGRITKFKGTAASYAPAIGAIALGVGVVAFSSSQGLALNECGADAVGQDTLNCPGGAYATGITYAGSDGLTLNLNNNTITVGGKGVSVTGTGTGAITVNGTSFDTITTNSIFAHGLYSYISNLANTATATALLTAGDINTSGDAAYGVYARTDGLGATVAQMDGGTVTTGGSNARGLYSHISNTDSTATATALLTAGKIETSGISAYGVYARTDGLGASLAQMDGGTITTGAGGAFGLYSFISNATNTATATALLTAGDIVTSGGNAHGVYARASGLGATLAKMDGGTLTTTSIFAFGLYSEITNTTSTATATALLTAGDIVTSGANAPGVYARNYGLGESLAKMDGGTITTGAGNSFGLYSVINNSANTQTATALLTAGKIETSGSSAHGVYVRTTGLGETLAQMDGGTVTTGGSNAHGLYSYISNLANTATATALLKAGDIKTSGDFAYGVYARTFGLGETLAQMDGGTITTGGRGAHGLYSEISNFNNTQTATAQLTKGDIETSGNIAHGIFAVTNGLGASLAQMDGGTITTGGSDAYGLDSAINNTTSTATAMALLTAGDIETSGNRATGIHAQTDGLGESLAQMDGGTITTGGDFAYGLFSVINNTTSTATATALLTAGDIKTSGSRAHGVYATTIGLGETLAQMDGGTLTTGGNSTYGLYSHISNTDSTATATALLTAGKIETSGIFAHGVYSTTRGLGATLAQMDVGTITTTGRDAYGLYSFISNGTNTATATALLTAGDIKTSGSRAHGVYATTIGLGETLAQMDGGTLTTGGNSAYGLYSHISNTDSTATATALLTAGKIETSGISAHGVYSTTRGLGESLAQMDGGTITTGGDFAYGLYSFISNATNTATATALVTAGKIETSGSGAHGVYVRTGGLGEAKVDHAGGTVETKGDGAYGLYAMSLGGISVVTQGAGGSVITAGTGADGIRAEGATGFDVDVAGSVNSSASTGIHTVSPAGGTIDIAAGAVVVGGDGVTIRDGDFDDDGIDETGGNVVVTTAGIVTGDAILGIGDDVFNLTGGVYTGDIYGDDRDDPTSDDLLVNHEGNDTFNWSGGDLNSGFFGQDGSDMANILAGANYEGTEIMDGGDDVLTADGFIDSLTIQGQVVTTQGSLVRNWENVIIDGGEITFSDNMLVVGSEPGNGLTLQGGAILNALTGTMALTGNLVNNGVVNMQDGATGDSVSVSGDYTGAGEVLVDTDFANDVSDTLVIGGNATGTTMVVIDDVTTGTATGNDVLVVDVAGTSSAGSFTSDTITSGAYLYDLNQVGADWYLQSTLDPTMPVGPKKLVPTAESFAPAVTVIQNMGSDYIGNLWERMGHREAGWRASGRTTEGSGVWGRAHGKLLHAGGGVTSSGASYETNHGFLQAGIDFAGFNMDEGDIVLAIMGHMGKSDTDVDNAIGAKISTVDADSYGVGGSVTFYNASQTFYADAVGQVTWYDVDINSTQFGNLGSQRTAKANTDGFGYAFSFEAGYRHALSDDWSFVPQAQIIYSNTDFDATTDSEGVALSVHDGDSLEGRIGFALEGQSDVSAGYFRANLIQEFEGRSSVMASGTEFTASVHGTSVEMSAGGSFIVSPGVRLYTDITGRTGLSNDVYSARGTVGAKVSW